MPEGDARAMYVRLWRKLGLLMPGKEARPTYA